jgi:zinc transport system substrate-binding protein
VIVPLSKASGVVLVLAILLGACGGPAASSGDRVEVVGSFYPLAWVAVQIGGDRVEVSDLTPPGVEAHDTSLSARQVAEVHDADIVLILGFIGFQPQVEDAARQSSATVVEVTKGLDLRPSEETGLSADPHVWLDPVLMERIADAVTLALGRADPSGRAEYEARGAAVNEQLRSLDTDYRAGLEGCAFATFVTTHEAFGYLADEYGLRELGIEGLTPEAEPAAEQLRAAEEAIRSGEAAPAVFFEQTDEGERIGRSVASSVGVEALPLGTLEFDPSPEDYGSVMRANLASLRRGLQCP